MPTTRVARRHRRLWARGIGLLADNRKILDLALDVVNRVSIVLLLVAVGFGCAAAPTNPSFPISTSDADAALRECQSHPKRLVRPLVIVGGFGDPGVGPALVRDPLSRCFTDSDRFICVTVAFNDDFDGCRRQIIDAVERADPSPDAGETAEVDVIGISMGGLAARYAAEPKAGRRRLNVARLFTISSPLQGAKLAELPTWDRKQRAMRAGSPFLRELAQGDATATFEVIPYVRLGDEMVGEANAAPAGRVAWWVAPPPFESSHMAASDPRILADIACRLRGEAPFTREPPAPLPLPR